MEKIEMYSLSMSLRVELERNGAVLLYRNGALQLGLSRKEWLGIVDLLQPQYREAVLDDYRADIQKT